MGDEEAADDEDSDFMFNMKDEVRRRVVQYRRGCRFLGARRLMLSFDLGFPCIAIERKKSDEKKRMTRRYFNMYLQHNNFTIIGAWRLDRYFHTLDVASFNFISATRSRHLNTKWLYHDAWHYINTSHPQPGSDSGCTAVVALLHGRQLYVANIGDSRCVLSRSGRAVDMSDDHKPEDEPELQRIVKAGGKVTMDGRVNGGLNLSRAFGEWRRGGGGGVVCLEGLSSWASSVSLGGGRGVELDPVVAPV